MTTVVLDSQGVIIQGSFTVTTLNSYAQQSSCLYDAITGITGFFFLLNFFLMKEEFETCKHCLFMSYESVSDAHDTEVQFPLRVAESEVSDSTYQSATNRNSLFFFLKPELE